MIKVLRGAMRVVANVTRAVAKGPRGGEPVPHGTIFPDVVSVRELLQEAQTLRRLDQERLRKDEERGRDLAPCAFARDSPGQYVFR